MIYQNIQRGTFIARPNRFLAFVELAGESVICHVKNTGRCRELLLPGATVYLEPNSNPARKTKFDLIAVEKGTRLINMDAQAPNRIFAEWVQEGNRFSDLTLLRPETTYGNSRFDFYWESSNRSGFVEVKGVTLEENGVVRFPDAPTQRGVKHLEELIAARGEGYQAALCFVVQLSGAAYFEPNDSTHPAFGEALRRAVAAGVDVFALECSVTPEELKPGQLIPVRLN